MRKLRLLYEILLTGGLLFVGQQSFSQVARVQLLDNYTTLPPQLNRYLKTGTVAFFKKELAAGLLKTKPAFLNFSFNFENRNWEVELKRNELLSDGFFVSTGSNPGEKVSYHNTALHYRGNIKGKPHSFAAITIQGDKLIAVIADESGNINIGAINTPEATMLNQHIIYRDAALKIQNTFSCQAKEELIASDNPVPVYKGGSITATTINAEPVDIYFEADYSMYTNNGSNVTNTVNYIIALFNVVHTLYENDSINTKISAVKIWTAPDPFTTSTTTGQLLSAFSASVARGFPGDIAHFLSQRNLGGGIASVNILCAGNASKVGLSANLSNSFNLFPTYSWSAMVITHETGHNLGSPHTQSCTWPGGAIDNCYETEGSCAQGPAPVNGGTLMSYCHLTGYGINFSNGFGPLPGALIRNKVRDNPCINPGVYFESTFQTVSEEDADTKDGCLDYRIVSTVLKIAYPPSQPANITLVPTVGAGLTIGAGKDVEISPASFVLGTTTLFQPISFKINNDALVENTESLTLNFDLDNNGGNAVKRNLSSFYSLSILSKDHAPDSLNGQMVYYESFDSVTSGLGSWKQTVVYGAASPNRWIIGSGNADFSGNAAFISNNAGSNTYSGSAAGDSTIVRLESPTINAAGFSNLLLSYLYKCGGEADIESSGGVGAQGLIVGKDYGRIYYSVNNGTNWILLKDNLFDRTRKLTEEIALPPAANKSSTLKIAFEWLNNSDSVRNPPFIIDSIVIKGKTFTPVQSLQDTANTVQEYVGAFETIHYYNPVTQRIMATIENTGATDLGCIAVSLVRTGTGSAAAWDTANATRISDKVYKVTPATSTAPYKLSLYYTKEEIDGWLAETGNTSGDITLVNSHGDLTDTPVIADQSFLPVNIFNYGTNSDITLTGTFTGTSFFAVMKSFNPVKCPGTQITYAAGIPGTGFQWQVNKGNGFNNIGDSTFYAGALSNLLSINLPPTNYYGYQFRCAVTTAAGVIYSPEYTLKFGVTWLGSVSKNWEDPANWGCGILPDEFTDVIINAGTSFNPEINSSTVVRSLTLAPGSSLNVKTGAALIIKK